MLYAWIFRNPSTNIPTQHLREAAQIVSRGVPGTIFLHELTHWAGNPDPHERMLLKNPAVLGEAIRHVNKIRRELGHEQRRQYKAKKNGRRHIEFALGPVYIPEEQ